MQSTKNTKNLKTNEQLIDFEYSAIKENSTPITNIELYIKKVYSIFILTVLRLYIFSTTIEDLYYIEKPLNIAPLYILIVNE